MRRCCLLIFFSFCLAAPLAANDANPTQESQRIAVDGVLLGKVINGELRKQDLVGKVVWLEFWGMG